MKKKIVYGILIGAMCCSFVGCGKQETQEKETPTESISIEDANANISDTLLENATTIEEDEQKKKEEEEKKAKEKLLKELLDDNKTFESHEQDTLYGKVYLDICLLRNYDKDEKVGTQDVLIKDYEITTNESILHAKGDMLTGGYWCNAPEYWVLKSDTYEYNEEVLGPMTYTNSYGSWNQSQHKDETYDISKIKELKSEYFVDLDVVEDKDGYYRVTGKLKPIYFKDIMLGDTNDFLYIDTSKISKPISMRIAFNKYTKECVYMMYFLSSSLDYLEDEGIKVEGYNVLINFDKYDSSIIYLPNEFLPQEEEETEEEMTDENNDGNVVIIDVQPEKTPQEQDNKKQKEEPTTQELTTEELTTEELPPIPEQTTEESTTENSNNENE